MKRIKSSQEYANEVVDLYETHYLEWISKKSFDLFEKNWLDAFLKLLPGRANILDLGCGIGIPIAAYFLGKGYQVTGVDTSASMLEVCKQQFPDQVWILEDMRSLDLKQMFDGVIAWDSFFHLPQTDQIKLLGKMASHIKPKGGLLFTAGSEHSERYGELGGIPLYHASLAPEAYRNLLNQLDFTVLDFIIEDPDCRDHTVCLAQKNAL